MQRIDGGAPFALIMPPELTERLKRVQKRHNMTRAEAMRLMTSFGLDVYEDYEKLGVVKLAEIFKRAKKAIEKHAGQQPLFKD